MITCTDVLEHVRSPADCLASWHALLRPGGLLLIATVDAHHWLARVMRSRWVHIHREHLWYFAKRHLRAIVEGAQFEVLDQFTPKRVYNARYLLAVLKNRAPSPALRATAGVLQRLLPKFLLDARLPRIREGQALLARKRQIPCE